MGLRPTNGDELPGINRFLWSRLCVGDQCRSPLAEPRPKEAVKYKTAFGMQETNRIAGGPGGAEIFLNFGATVDAAKANKAEPIVITHRDSDDLKDPIAHVILNVKDMTATVAALKAAGGSMTGDPRPFGNTRIVIGIATDPVGNRIEMIQRP